MNRAAFTKAVKVLLVTIVAVPAAALAITAIFQQSSFLGLFAFFASIPAFLLGMTLFCETENLPPQTIVYPRNPNDEYFAINDMNPRTARDWIAHDTRVDGESRIGPHRFD